MTLSVDYDDEADTLYLSLGEPRPAVGEVDDKGVILRYALDNEDHCGVTVPWFKEWADEREDLASRISTFLSVPKTEVMKSLLTF